MKKILTYSSMAIIMLLNVAGVCGQQKDISRILWTANWSHDNKYIAVGGVDKKIRILSGNSFDLVKIIENKTSIQRLSWHPYLNLLAVAAIGDGSKIIDIERDSIIGFKGMNSNGTRAIAWNYNGNLLANADYEGEITIWDTHGELVRTIRKENTKGNVAVDWHPFRNEIIALSDFVRIYNSEGKLLKKFEHRKEDVLMLCVKWHKSGDFFVIGDYGDKGNGYKPLLQYWNSDGTLKREVNISKSEYRNVAWTKLGDKLATASDALRIWTKNGELIAEGVSEDNLWGVDWSSDGKYIVTSSFEGYIKIWDANAKLVKAIK
ncbi:MAG TPA: hypothetical protein VK166_16750 [Chitinophagaceae bacterium]|nr:hypothetical protein [Chitinophagaceae bacterium]